MLKTNIKCGSLFNEMFILRYMQSYKKNSFYLVIQLLKTEMSAAVATDLFLLYFFVEKKSLSGYPHIKT